MTTWLDDYSAAVATRVFDEAGVCVDARETMRGLTSAAMRRIEAGSRCSESLRFDADLFAFYSDEFADMRAAFSVSPGLGRRLLAREPIDEERDAFEQHLTRCDFTLIHCAGAFPLGADVEVKSILIKAAMVVDAKNPRSVRTKDCLRYEIVLGRTGRFSLQRLSCSGDLIDVGLVQDSMNNDLFNESTPPLDLIEAAGWTSRQVVMATLAFAIGTIAHASRNHGSALTWPVSLPGSSVSAHCAATRPFEVVSLVELDEALAQGHG